MADGPPRRTSAWIAFAAGVVATLAVVLVWWAVGASRRAGDVKLRAALPAPAELPRPHLPDAPRLPDAPVPEPR